jgi:hypothetical protein
VRSIGKRLDELSRLLTDRPFDEFALLKKDILKPALTGYDPSTSLKKFFQEQLFDKHNAIAHYGESDFHKQDGKQCLSMTSALIDLFHGRTRRSKKGLPGFARLTAEAAVPHMVHSCLSPIRR